MSAAHRCCLAALDRSATPASHLDVIREQLGSWQYSCPPLPAGIVGTSGEQACADAAPRTRVCGEASASFSHQAPSQTRGRRPGDPSRRGPTLELSAQGSGDARRVAARHGQGQATPSCTISPDSFMAPPRCRPDRSRGRASA